MLKTLFRTSLLAGLLLLAACRMAPVYNVHSEPLNAPQNATLEDVTEAIKRAGLGLGWQLKSEAPGNMSGRLSLRDHVAMVDIKYDTKALSITYADSINLKYNGSQIHKNYNGWVSNLRNAILVQVSAI